MRSKLRIVAFVQESETMRVIGVGTAQVR
jgi:hypothetical protein